MRDQSGNRIIVILAADLVICPDLVTKADFMDRFFTRLGGQLRYQRFCIILIWFGYPSVPQHF